MTDASKTKNRRLWQLFFEDEEDGQTNKVPGSSEAAADVNKKQGVIYQGLLEADSEDSDQELPRTVSHGEDRGDWSGAATGEPEDLKLGVTRETVFYGATRGTGNGAAKKARVKAFKSSDWETFEIQEDPGEPGLTPTTSHPAKLAQDGGIRYIIRSESDLELAIPASQRKKTIFWCCKPAGTEKFQTKTERWISYFLLAMFMAAVYVAVIIAIVYGSR